MLNRQFLSIDISPSGIKLGRFQVKYNILYILDLQSFLGFEQLRDYLSRMKLRNMEVIGNLGGVHVVARSVSVSSLGKVDAEREITKAIKQQIPSSAKNENIVMKYQVLSTSYDSAKETLDILAAVAKESAIIDFIELMKGINLLPTIIDAGSISLFLPFVGEYEKAEATAIINIENDRTDVVVVENGLPYFVSQYGSGEDDFHQSKSSFCRGLFSILDYYGSDKKKKQPIQKIIISGRGVDEVKSYLAKKTDTKVKVANLKSNPFLRMKKEFNELNSYARVVALGLRKVFPALLEINLVSNEMRDRLQYAINKQRLRRWSIIFSSVLASILGILLLLNLYYSFKLRNTSTILKNIQAELNASHDLRAKNRSLREKILSIKPLIKNEISWDRVLHEISKLTPSDLWIESITSNTHLKKNGNDSILRERILHIEGGTVDQSRLDQFISKLEDSNLFSDVQIEGMEKKDYICFELKMKVTLTP